jgi:hypothetical protein
MAAPLGLPRHPPPRPSFLPFDWRSVLALESRYCGASHPASPWSATTIALTAAAATARHRRRRVCFACPPVPLSSRAGSPHRAEHNGASRAAGGSPPAKFRPAAACPCLGATGAWDHGAHWQGLKKGWGAQIRRHVAFWVRVFLEKKKKWFPYFSKNALKICILLIFAPNLVKQILLCFFWVDLQHKNIACWVWDVFLWSFI